MKTGESIIPTVTPPVIVKKVEKNKPPEQTAASSKYNDCILRSIKFIYLVKIIVSFLLHVQKV